MSPLAWSRAACQKKKISRRPPDASKKKKRRTGVAFFGYGFLAEKKVTGPARPQSARVAYAPTRRGTTITSSPPSALNGGVW